MAEKGAGFVSCLFAAIGFGLMSSSILGFILGSTTTTQFDLNSLFDNTRVSDVANLTNYFTVLLSWALGGVVAGVRGKEKTKSGLAGFFGAFVGALLAVVLFIMNDLENILYLVDGALTFNASPLLDPLPGFLVGAVGTIVAATLSGAVVGRSMYEPPASKAKGRSSRRTWADKKKWKCSRCGTDLPPGEMNCPKCGAGVIQ